MDYSFGIWVKRRRKALDLTQQALAQRVGCSLSLIFKIESDERRPSRQIAELLTEHLEIPPAERDLFLKVARSEKAFDSLETLSSPLIIQSSTPSFDPPSPAREAPLTPPDLPVALTSFVGREHELSAIVRQMQDRSCRLLTLTGPGGVGKTRLALEAAHHLRDSFSHGVFFASLAGTSTPEFMIPAVADALGFSFSGTLELKAQLFHFLKEREILLVLDNLEHLLAGVQMLDELLEFAPHVRLISTSREPLNLRAEWVFEVQGLPISSSTDPENFELTSAGALFLQRAKQVSMSFQPSQADLQAIARICQLVDGLPLGIELAATWVKTLSCREIADEIAHGLDFLATSRRDIPERHRSLNAVFDYSWNLLSPEEQDVLKRLSVFQGGFPRDAAAQVAGAKLPLLSALVSKSLVRHSDSERYDQHELVRQYASVRLQADPQSEDTTRDGHAAYYLGLWHESEKRLKSSDQRNTLQALIADIDNFHAAWDRAVAQKHVALLYQCLRSFLIVYDLYGWHTNGIKRLDTLLQTLRSQPEADRALEIHGLAAAFQGWFHFRRGHLQEASDRFEEGLGILRPLGDSRVLADVLTLASTVMTSLGQSEKALQYISEGLTAARASGDDWRIAHASMMEGGILAGWGDYDRAYSRSLEALTHFRVLGDTRLIVVTLNTLGFVALQSSRYAEARQHLLEALTLIHPAEDPWSAGTVYGNLGIVELEQGNLVEARRLLQRSIPLVADLGMMADVAHFMTYLGDTDFRQGAVEEAESHWRDAIRTAYEAQAMPTVLAVLIRLAQLDAGQGHFVRAYKWAAFVARHTAAWHDSKSFAERLCWELAPQFSEEQLHSLQAAAREETIEHLTQEILSRDRGENNRA